MTTKAKILETFVSIQGEGKYAGVKQVFVRFFECNMHCAWCDTPHSIGDTTRRFDEQELNELAQKVEANYCGCHSVSITGGEPMLQTPFLKEFLPRLKQRGVKIYLETNGIFHDELNEIIDSVDIIAMDLKLPSSTKCKEYWLEHQAFLKNAIRKETFIKTVITGDTDTSDVRRAIDLVKEVDQDLLFILQPNYFEMKDGAMDKCLEFYETCCADLSNVRILPQTHKMMKVR